MPTNNPTIIINANCKFIQSLYFLCMMRIHEGQTVIEICEWRAYILVTSPKKRLTWASLKV
ncbi:hypothetical protein PESHB5_09110 [Pediococcus parvulus]